MTKRLLHRAFLGLSLAIILAVIAWQAISNGWLGQLSSSSSSMSSASAPMLGMACPPESTTTVCPSIASCNQGQCYNTAALSQSECEATATCEWDTTCPTTANLETDPVGYNHYMECSSKRCHCDLMNAIGPPSSSSAASSLMPACADTGNACVPSCCDKPGYNVGCYPDDGEMNPVCQADPLVAVGCSANGVACNGNANCCSSNCVDNVCLAPDGNNLCGNGVIDPGEDCEGGENCEECKHRYWCIYIEQGLGKPARECRNDHLCARYGTVDTTIATGRCVSGLSGTICSKHEFICDDGNCGCLQINDQFVVEENEFGLPNYYEGQPGDIVTVCERWATECKEWLSPGPPPNGYKAFDSKYITGEIAFGTAPEGYVGKDACGLPCNPPGGLIAGGGGGEEEVGGGGIGGITGGGPTGGGIGGFGLFGGGNATGGGQSGGVSGGQTGGIGGISGGTTGGGAASSIASQAGGGTTGGGAASSLANTSKAAENIVKISASVPSSRAIVSSSSVSSFSSRALSSSIRSSASSLSSVVSSARLSSSSSSVRFSSSSSRGQSSSAPILALSSSSSRFSSSIGITLLFPSSSSSRSSSSRSSSSSLFSSYPSESSVSSASSFASQRLVTYVPLPSSVSSAPSVCGNYTLERLEECDDGNRSDLDGCSSSCLFERGSCGDGIVQSLLNEQCEPSIGSDVFTCQLNCRYLLMHCGDGIVDPGEACDQTTRLNSNAPGALCRPDCSSARCGDSVLDPSEECDDGNRLSGDACDVACRIERMAAVPTQALPASVFELPFTAQTTSQLSQNIPVSPLGAVVTPVTPPATTNTGPEALLVIAAGAAGGYAWIRRRKA